MSRRWILILIAFPILIFSFSIASAQVAHSFLIHDFKFGGIALAEEVRSVHRGENYTLVVILPSSTARIENVSFENSSLQFNSNPTRISSTNWVLNLYVTDGDSGALKTISINVSYLDANLTLRNETCKIEILIGPPMPQSPLHLALYQIASPEFQGMPIVVRGTVEQIIRANEFYKIVISDGTSTAKITSTLGNFTTGDRVKVAGEIRFEGEIYSSNISKIMKLDIEAPVVISQGKEYKITIKADGKPVEGATVIIEDSLYLTDENGFVFHRFNATGTVSIEAKKEDYISTRALVVVEKQAPGFEFAPAAVSLLIYYFMRKLLKQS
ncbi:MAG: hypothetical protein QXL78_07015 [Methanocellales archaeon]